MAKGIVIGGLNGGGSNVKSTQSGSVVVNALSTDVPISSVDMNKSIVLLSTNPPSYGMSSITLEAKLTTNTNLNLSRYLNSGSIVIYWQVIEFNNIKSLQMGETISSATTEITKTINLINPNKSFIIHSFKLNSGSTGANDYAMYSRIINSSSIGMKHINPSEKTIYWYVVEFN